MKILRSFPPRFISSLKTSIALYIQAKSFKFRQTVNRLQKKTNRNPKPAFNFACSNNTITMTFLICNIGTQGLNFGKTLAEKSSKILSHIL